ncbi:MAG: hypothetical protein ABR555_03785 [Pyrinomonadaceae bacterium]
MKRCPKCNFIYLDEDQLCDLDGATLIEANEAEIDLPIAALTAEAAVQQNAATNKGSTRRIVVLLIAAVLAFVSTTALLVYESAHSFRNPLSSAPELQRATVSSRPEPARLANPQSDPAVALAPTATIATPTPAVRSTRTAVSNSPLSTGSQEQTQTGHIVIYLENGAQIDADEVWRAKEGIWYRRSGMVTLLNRSQVKSIENTTR